MKKTLLSLALSIGALSCFSQVVIFEVLTPEEVQGNYNVEFAPAGAAGWPLVPDLTVPENSVTGALAIGRDGTAGDSLGCEPLINPEEVDGKIALIWRGACDFAVKAANAYDAGAIAVLIVNNVAGAAPIVPGGGTSGAANLVDVPVAMIGYEIGEALIPHIDAGTATGFLGAVVFENDLTMTPELILRPEAGSIPVSIAQNADELSIPMGGFIVNSGSETQTGVSMTATVTLDGNELYANTAGDEIVEPGDSVFITLPNFEQETYPVGLYEIIYSMDADLDDEFDLDNQPVNASFAITEDLYSFSPWNPVTGHVDAIRFQRQAEFNEVFEHCIHFRDPNASRLRLEGMHFATTSDEGTVLTGEFIDIRAYTWEDEFETIDDATVDQIIDFDYGLYDFTEDIQEEQIYVEFDNQVVLEDNVRYLFCVAINSPTVRLGYGPSTADYTTTAASNGQPTFPIFTATELTPGTTFFFPGFGLEWAPATAAQLVDITVGTKDQEKVDITPYPNPTMDYIAIPYNGTAGNANMMIYDNVGKLVKSTNMNFAGNNMIQVDMAGVPNGNYVFNMQFTDGTTSTFKVVVAR